MKSRPCEIIRAASGPSRSTRKPGPVSWRYTSTPRPSAAIWRSEQRTNRSQSQLVEAKTSPNRQRECMRTSTPGRQAAFAGGQGKNVAGTGQVRRLALGIDGLQDGAGAVGGGYSGGDAYARVNGFTEGGAEIGGVSRGHERQAKVVAALRRERQ